MTTLVLGARAIHHKFTSVNILRINWKLVYSIGIGLSLLMVIFYIFLINQLTSGVYIIKSYNGQINILSQENNTLQAHFAQADFLGQAMVKAENLHFEKTTNIAYVQILESPLAIK